MLDSIYNYLINPIISYDFMQNALFALLILSISSPITGVFLTIRKMSLSGDAISHAILPGTALSFLFYGLSITAMTIGGLIAGVFVITISALFSRISKSTEDSSLAVFYLVSLALGVLIVSISGSNIDLLHFLFGSVFAINDDIIYSLGIITSINLITLSIIIRPLIIDSMDSLYLSSVSKSGPFVHLLFMIITVMNLVAGFQAIGTLMAVGLMIIPAVCARFWSLKLSKICLISTIFSIISVNLGLIISFNFDLPCSPCIILSLGALYLLSFVFGKQKGLIWLFIKTKHLEA